MDQVLQTRLAATLSPTISDLSGDLVGEILSRVPISCLRAVRCTCKQWNVLSKTWIVCKAEATNEFLGFMVKDYRIYSMRFNLRGILSEEEGEEPSINEIGGNFLNQVEIYKEIYKVFHCDGLLLCFLRDDTRLVVWNPYLGQTRWIEPRKNFHWLDRYTLGYDKNKNHKILRFLGDALGDNTHVFGYEIYDISSSSWRVLDITPNWDIDFYQRGVSLKGNTYFFAKPKLPPVEEVVEVQTPLSCLLCFDFTTERFGQFLPLPFFHTSWDIGSLSSLRDESLAALYHGCSHTCDLEIWVTTKIEPNAVSWIPFLKVDMLQLTGFYFRFHPNGSSFFIDEEKKIAVVFDIHGPDDGGLIMRRAAYIIGENDYFKKVDLGEPQVHSTYFYPLVCSYAPSLAEINQAT